MRVVYKVTDLSAVEHYVKGLISHLVYKNNKDFYIIKRKTLNNTIDDNSNSDNNTIESKDSDEDEYFAIVS